MCIIIDKNVICFVPDMFSIKDSIKENNYVDYLNNNPHGEKFRIMTKEELFYILENRTNQKQLFL